MKRWKCCYCRRKYARISIWFHRHFEQKHPGLPHRCITEGYELIARDEITPKKKAQEGKDSGQ